MNSVLLIQSEGGVFTGNVQGKKKNPHKPKSYILKFTQLRRFEHFRQPKFHHSLKWKSSKRILSIQKLKAKLKMVQFPWLGRGHTIISLFLKPRETHKLHPQKQRGKLAQTKVIGYIGRQQFTHLVLLKVVRVPFQHFRVLCPRYCQVSVRVSASVECTRTSGFTQYLRQSTENYLQFEDKFSCTLFLSFSALPWKVQPVQIHAE